MTVSLPIFDSTPLLHENEASFPWVDRWVDACALVSTTVPGGRQVAVATREHQSSGWVAREYSRRSCWLTGHQKLPPSCRHMPTHLTGLSPVSEFKFLISSAVSDPTEMESRDGRILLSHQTIKQKGIKLTNCFSQWQQLGGTQQGWALTQGRAHRNALLCPRAWSQHAASFPGGGFSV